MKRKYGVVATMPACENNTMCAPQSEPVMTKDDERALAGSGVPFSNICWTKLRSGIRRNPLPSPLSHLTKRGEIKKTKKKNKLIRLWCFSLYMKICSLLYITTVATVILYTIHLWINMQLHAYLLSLITRCLPTFYTCFLEEGQHHLCVKTDVTQLTGKPWRYTT